MDKIKTTQTFLENIGRFDQIVLLSDQEVLNLFGSEVTASLVTLDRFGRENGVCATCGGVCCSEIGCELYLPQFGMCPIYDARPLLCRFHFCHRFGTSERSLVVELRDIFLACYMMADRISDGAIAKSMNTPPFRTACPDLVAVTRPWVESVRNGEIDPQRAADLIRREAAIYRRTRTGYGRFSQNQ